MPPPRLPLQLAVQIDSRRLGRQYPRLLDRCTYSVHTRQNNTRSLENYAYKIKFTYLY